MEKKKISISIKSVLIVIAIIAIIVTAIVLIVMNRGNESKENEIDPNALTESEYQTMEVNDIKVTYDESTGKSQISFVIKNTTTKKLENKYIDIILMNEREQQLAGIQTKIDLLESNEEKTINATLSGDGREIKKARVQKTPEETPQEQQEEPQGIPEDQFPTAE